MRSGGCLHHMRQPVRFSGQIHCVHYSGHMFTITQTGTFADWFDDLADDRARKAIARRLVLLTAGHFGNVKGVGDKVMELRIAYWPGYRLYLTRRGEELILMLVGGTKQSQTRDIEKAKLIAAGLP